jgi:hypothetical protein
MDIRLGEDQSFFSNSKTLFTGFLKISEIFKAKTVEGVYLLMIPIVKLFFK